MECVLSEWPLKPRAGLPRQPPLVPLPLATHPTWSEASTPLRRSKLGKVDEALSLSLSPSLFFCLCFSSSLVFTPDMPFPLSLHFTLCVSPLSPSLSLSLLNLVRKNCPTCLFYCCDRRSERRQLASASAD